MARRAITKDFKLGFIEAHLEFYKGNHPSAEIDNYQEVDDKKLDSYYRKVYADVTPNNATSDTTDNKDEVTPKAYLEHIFQDLLEKNHTYDEWKVMKGIVEKFISDVDCKMRETASIALAEKAEHLAKLQAEIEELKSKL